MEQISKQDEKKKLELEKLREQYDQEQKYKEDNLSKNVSKNKKEKVEDEMKPEYGKIQFINRSGSTWSYKIDAMSTSTGVPK